MPFLCTMCLSTNDVAIVRGDMIHAGCLLDLMNRSGLRMHGCLPLTAMHTGCGINGTIEWHTHGDCGDEYASHLLRENGSSFIDTLPKDGQFCYALDIVERFQNETKGHRSLSEIDDETLTKLRKLAV